jgi:hypothetical protein
MAAREPDKRAPHVIGNDRLFGKRTDCRLKQQTRHHLIGIGKFFTRHRCDIQDRITIILARVVAVVTAVVVAAS